MIPFSRRLSWSVVLMLAAGSAAVVLAQEKNDAPNGSLAALTAEIRQLRVAVEESTRSQTQTQALGVYLSVQQSRILQAATRLESARKELDAVSLRSREIASQLENFQGEILRVTEPQRRAQLEDAKARDGSEEVEPPSLADEIGRTWPGPGDVVGEVGQEDHADRVVVEPQQDERLLIQRQEQQDHDHEGEHGQHEDEQVVGVAVGAHHGLIRAHP